jgi:hypothetical protein
MSSIGAIGRQSVIPQPVMSTQSQGVKDAFRDALPSLFHDNEKSQLSQLQARPPQVFASGTDKKGAVKLTYTVKDAASAKTIANMLAGRYSQEDESWVGDNISMPNGTQLDNFHAIAKGKQVQITIDWSQQ